MINRTAMPNYVWKALARRASVGGPLCAVMKA